MRSGRVLAAMALLLSVTACDDDEETPPGADPDGGFVPPPRADAGPPPTPADAAPPDAPPGVQLVVLLDDRTTDVRATAMMLTADREAVIGQVWETALKGFSVTLPEARREELCTSDEVVRCDDDLPVQAFCHMGELEITPVGVSRLGARANTIALAGNVGVDVAVLDTGIQGANEDLRVHRAFACTALEGCQPIMDPMTATDGIGHGTQVAGVIGAIDDDDRIVGVAPGARIWGIQVLDASGMGRTSTLIGGLDVVAQNAGSIEIATVALGGLAADDPSDCASSVLHRAVCGVTTRGVVVVAAAGNGQADVLGTVPAAYDQVITVSAVNANDQFATFSNFGMAIDLAAPGVSVLSVAPTGAKGGGCKSGTGTSMAAAHVAGAAALWIAAHGRDCTGDGKTNASDVTCIRNALVDAGLCANGQRAGSSCSIGFSGDPDGRAEPLVYVADPF